MPTSTSTTTPSANSKPTVASGSSFRLELQGLRALAVGLVLLHHLWPARMTGGFVGVDVFFVISGFLIVGHLFKELLKTGTIRLGQFWARRVRRLLPLAFLVLAVTLGLLFLFMPQTTWDPNLRQLLGATFYALNWVLAIDAVDYSAQDNDQTMVLHYWSLSVEEQFYLVLPILLLTAVFIWAKVKKKKASAETAAALRIVLIVTLAILGAASLVFSIIYTNYSPSQAYFVTPTRFWEFCVGGLLALLAPSPQRSPVLSNLLGWGGLAMVIFSAFWLTGASLFPGYVALVPVIGTALFIRYGTMTRGVGVYWWASRPAFVRLGDWSYAIYLWHWPLIVLASTTLDSFLWYHKIVLALIAIFLSALSQKFVEDPIRFAPALKPSRRSFAMMAVGMAVISAFAIVTPRVIPGTQAQEYSTTGECTGANAMLNDCSDEEIFTSDVLVPPADVVEQRTDDPLSECNIPPGDVPPTHCELGAPAEESTRTAAIIGDSHARMWLPLLDDYGKAHGWTIKTYTKSGCTPLDLNRTEETNTAASEETQACTDFVANSAEEIAEDESIDVVFTAASRVNRTYYDDANNSGTDVTDEGFDNLWQRWKDAGKDVVVFKETPHFGDVEIDIPQCIESNPESADEDCSETVENTSERRANLTAAAESSDTVAATFDPNPGLCREGRCYGLVGGMVAYYDHHHLASDFVRTYIDDFEAELEEQGVAN